MTPPEIGGRGRSSEALINIRLTLRRAAREGILPKRPPPRPRGPRPRDRTSSTAATRRSSPGAMRRFPPPLHAAPRSSRAVAARPMRSTRSAPTRSVCSCACDARFAPPNRPAAALPDDRGMGRRPRRGGPLAAPTSSSAKLGAVTSCWFRAMLGTAGGAVAWTPPRSGRRRRSETLRPRDAVPRLSAAALHPRLRASGDRARLDVARPDGARPGRPAHVRGRSAPAEGALPSSPICRPSRAVSIRRRRRGRTAISTISARARANSRRPMSMPACGACSTSARAISDRRSPGSSRRPRAPGDRPAAALGQRAVRLRLPGDGRGRRASAVQPFALNFDAVAHETGHLVLFGVMASCRTRARRTQILRLSRGGRRLRRAARPPAFRHRARPPAQAHARQPPAS